jgi:FAD:protein FMN transferase
VLKFILVFLLGGWLALLQPGKKIFRIAGSAQGTTYSISYVSDDSLISKTEVDSIFHAIDLSLSLYNEKSLINRFNREGAIVMDDHMKRVVLRSLDIWKASHGCFDITVKNLVDLWGFGVQGKGHIPSSISIGEALVVTGSRYLSISGDTLKAIKKNVRIDCNGIAQGYSVDVIFHFLESKGFENILVEVGGEVRAGGRKDNGDPWRIGIESPSRITENWYPVEEVLQLEGSAVTTSGNYRKYFMQQGKKYSHVIDPRKGKPVDNGIISVTVIAPDAITADGWDNGFYVLGIDSSFAILKRNAGLEFRIVYQDSKGNIRDTSSAGFKAFLVK